MRLFATDEEVSQLQAPTAGAAGAAGGPDNARALEITLSLAWYLRQRDSTRAQSLAGQVAARLPDCALPAAARRCIEARLDLLGAEMHWLNARLDTAAAVAARAGAAFFAHCDLCGCADAQWLLAQIAGSQGQHRQRDAALGRAIADATEGGDSERATFFTGALGKQAFLSDARHAALVWGTRFVDPREAFSPVALATIAALRGQRAYMSGDVVSAIVHLSESFDAAMQTGQTLNAILAASNIGDAFAVLNDLDAALEWMQRGLDLARPAGWPVGLAPCLRNVGEIMRSMGRLDAAKNLFAEAMTVYAPLRQSRSYANLLGALGDLALDEGAGEEALHYFGELGARARALEQTDLEINALLGASRADSLLGHSAEAQHDAEAALQLARSQGALVRQITALQLLAGIETARGNTALAMEHIEIALMVARCIDGYLVPVELLSALAEAYAARRCFAEAYVLAIEAGEMRERIVNERASNRAVAMQLKFDTERVHAQVEQHRQLAQAEAARAQLLERTSSMLEHLGAIGQEITAQLDRERAFEAIHRHVHGLLDSPCFAIYLMDADGLGLTSVYDIENGVRLAPDNLQLDDPLSNSVRCVRERRELLVEFSPEASNPTHIPGTLLTLSALFAPLIIGQRVLGVMTIQSASVHAYGEQERLIFRTLCAYAAIALDNATAYAHLSDARDQLVAHEKLAALGALVAGIAHELNTPIGNSLLMATSFQDRTHEMQRELAQPALRRSVLVHYIDDARTSMELIVRGLGAAAELVHTFKQVAVDRATEKRRRFDLRQTTEEVAATLQRVVAKAGHQMHIAVPEGISVDSYPGPYGQVLSNLINNAVLHAFEGRRDGQLRIVATVPRQGWVEIRCSDDGVGISEENQRRIFDPFFTTKLGQGGSGLGLSISYNIVTSLLGGEFSVASEVGHGTCFTLRIPLVAPAHHDAGLTLS